jgi:protein-L-isoaspartate(D-aspartate) O-methyltransferase
MEKLKFGGFSVDRLFKTIFLSQFSCATVMFFAVLLGTFILPTNISQAQRKRKPDYKKLREELVRVAIVGAGVKNKQVIESMLATERHEFMPESVRHMAYYDAGVPIGDGQTISSPFIVAYMTECLDPQPGDRVLEIGTGSGYQAAVLSPLVKEVYSIEIVKSLGEQAAKTLKRLKYNNVYTKVGDGFKGWKEKAPFDKIIVTCSPEKVPQPLIDQLVDGGLIVVPVGERHQQTLYLMRKKGGKLVREALRPTLFVPMTGTAESNRQVKPDPKNPKLLNGDFEEKIDENGFVPGWYYQRQLKHVEDDVLSPSGRHYIQFRNRDAGKPAHLMQAFAIDGQHVSKIEFSISAKTDDVLGIGKDVPVAAVTFLSEKREPLGTSFIPLRGTKPWKKYKREIRVPKKTKEALVRLNLLGATGTVAFDNVVIRKKD